ncbi:MAG: M48 family metalloprotease [Hydrogenophilaceae bacterium]|nr:M48 family metalloprotease [Hydrogenophilaceae bacterium]
MIRLIVHALLLTSTIALADDILPWTTATDAEALEREERNLWADAAEFDKALERAGMVRNDPALNAYLQGILNKLYPEFAGRLRIRALNAPHLNAFALPNGSIYINTGLLARLQNEAQLATVLAHEGVHFVHRHSFQQSERLKNSTALALLIGMLGVPLVGDIIALSSMTGFSQEHETEADSIGYQRLIAAGYSAKEAPRAFEHLIAEIKALDIDEPFFFASHPKLQDRVHNFSELTKTAVNGKTGYGDFLRYVSPVRLFTLEEYLTAYRFKQLILILSDPERRKEYPPEASYYLGEAYRLRGKEGDLALAEQQYLHALELAPNFAPTHRALGLIHFKRGEKALAAPLFKRYLELAPDAPDRGYVEHYLKDAGL